MRYSVSLYPDTEFEKGRHIFNEGECDDPQEAAERGADIIDCENEYLFLRPGKHYLYVLDGKGKRTKFEITGEAVPAYDAVEVEE